jgi:ABC-type amino acid transport system permease subunit
MIAGQSVGLPMWSSVWHIMVPQVITFSTPGLGSEYALLIKDSAYAYVIGGLAEIMTLSIRIKTTPPHDVVTPFVLAALLYIALTFPIAFWLDRWGNKRKKKIGL